MRKNSLPVSSLFFSIAKAGFLKRFALLKFFVYNHAVLTKRVKSKTIRESQRHEKDTGSAEVQISVLSRRIEELSSHLKKNPKDQHSRRGLLKMVSKRRKLLNYLKEKQPNVYAKLARKLGL